MTDEPLRPRNVTIDGVEVTPVDVRPSRKRGDPTAIEIHVGYEDDLDHQADRYTALKRYQEFAGEADYGQLLGGAPFVREHPLDDWRVDSHVVPVRYGQEIVADRSFWGVVVDVIDETVTVEPESAGSVTWGENDWGEGPWGGEYDGRSPNHHRLTFQIVPLARLGAYASREQLLEALSPTVNQLG